MTEDAALQKPADSRIGQASIWVNKEDFTLADFFVDLALQEADKDLLEAIREGLESSLDLYRLKHGTHPKFFNLEPWTPLRESKKMLRREYVLGLSAGNEIEEFRDLKPWQCFPDTKNAIDLFYKMRPEHPDLYKVGVSLQIILAILISETPKTAENFYSIVSASQHLAGQLLGGYILFAGGLHDYIESTIDNRTPAQKKIEGKKKGGKITATQKKEFAKIRDAQMEAWISLDHGGRGLARRLRKKFPVSERKAQDLISKVKKKSMQQA